MIARPLTAQAEAPSGALAGYAGADPQGGHSCANPLCDAWSRTPFRPSANRPGWCDICQGDDAAGVTFLHHPALNEDEYLCRLAAECYASIEPMVEAEAHIMGWLRARGLECDGCGDWTLTPGECPNCERFAVLDRLRELRETDTATAELAQRLARDNERVLAEAETTR